MKLYRKVKDSLISTNLMEYLSVHISKKLETEVGGFSDNSCHWIEIYQDNKERKERVTVSILFDEKKENITDINVYVAPIVTAVDEDQQEKLI